MNCKLHFGIRYRRIYKSNFSSVGQFFDRCKHAHHSKKNFQKLICQNQFFVQNSPPRPRIALSKNCQLQPQKEDCLTYHSSDNPLLYWISRNMPLWANIVFWLAVICNCLVAIFYPFPLVERKY